MSRRPLASKTTKPDSQAAISAFSHPKQPRQYAQECLALPEAERTDYLLTVPLEILEIVEFYVQDHERKLSCLVDRIVKQTTREQRLKIFEQTPSCVREEISKRVIAHYEKKRAQRNG